MNKYLFVSHFSGCGGSTQGAIASGFTPLLGIEFDPNVASIYRKNFGDKVLIKDVSQVKSSDLSMIPLECDRIKSNQILVWQTSPPCQEYSQANNNKDVTSERANVLISTMWQYELYRPEYVVLENVKGYAKSAPYLAFESYLMNLGYSAWKQFVNSADYGVPQTRERFIAIFAKKGYKSPQLFPTHSKKQDLLFNQWNGWGEAINDLIDNLDDSGLSERQREFLSTIPDKSLLRSPLLIERVGFYQHPKTRSHLSPCWTLRACLANDGKSENWEGNGRTDIINIVLPSGKVKKLNTRAIARLQSFPDSFQWSDSFKLNVHGIGNSVPPLLMQRICEAIKRCN